MLHQPTPRVSIVIPTWRRGDLLRQCLGSLRNQRFGEFETVIVSNGAGPWAEELAKEYGCRFLPFNANRGFAAAVNVGIGASNSPYVMVLNDDVELAPEWLEKAIVTLEEQPDISFLCGKISFHGMDVLDDAGDALSMGGGAWRLGQGRADGPEFDHPRPLIAVSLTAAVFRRAALEKVGRLDESFVSYLEDMDLSIRLWRAGLWGMYVPQAVAQHHGGASLKIDEEGTKAGHESPDRFRLMTRNQLLLVAKHYPLSLWLRLAPRIFWAQLLWAAMGIRKGLLGAYLTGLGQFARKLPGVVGRRAPWDQTERRAFLEWLRESERAIFADIAARPREKQDTYWWLYFALFRPGQAVDAGAPFVAPGEHRKAGSSSRGLP